MRLAELVETSRRVGETPGRSAKIALLAECLKRMTPDEARASIGFLAGKPRQEKLRVGYATLRRAMPDVHAAEPRLEILDVDRALSEIASPSGAGSEAKRTLRFRELLRLATREEQDFLFRVALGEVRQGALEGLLTDAVARAFDAAPSEVRRALMLEGDLGPVTAALAEDGAAALSRFSLRLFQPVQPMLAAMATDLDDALGRLGEAALEWKLDGARVQIHKSGGDVEVYSRRLNRVTPAVPEIVEAVRALPARELILDGEAIALGPGHRPHPFQVTMRRFGRRLDVERVRAELPLATFAFDILHLDGDSLIERPSTERWEALRAALPEPLRVPRVLSASPEDARRFLEQALGAGHEGIMAKALGTPYEAGRRGQAWLKVKPAHTLDLVVLAAEWGHGRRRGWLSNLHLGARDPRTGGFVMLGKTFKGMTDEMLAWQTERLSALEVQRDEWVVHVRPELVVEVAFNDVQQSPQYPGGVALRFARVKRYRPDKRPEDADTIDGVQALLPGLASG